MKTALVAVFSAFVGGLAVAGYYQLHPNVEYVDRIALLEDLERQNAQFEAAMKRFEESNDTAGMIDYVLRLTDPNNQESSFPSTP